MKTTNHLQKKGLEYDVLIKGAGNEQDTMEIWTFVLRVVYVFCVVKLQDFFFFVSFVGGQPSDSYSDIISFPSLIKLINSFLKKTEIPSRDFKNVFF